MARRQGRGTDPSNHGGERCAMIDNAKQTAGLALVVLLVAAASSAAAAAPHYQAEIRRTAYGIPHIRAQDEASLGFGMGYRSEEHTSELQSLMRISYAVFCLKKQNQQIHK